MARTKEQVTMMRTDRTGFALPAALLALVIVAALVTGGFLAASHEDQVSSSTRYADQAFLVAERGIQNVIGLKRRQFYEDSIGAIGDSVVLGPDTISVGHLLGRHTVTVKRLATRIFFVESEGEVLNGGRYAGAKRKLGQVVRTTNFNFAMDHALKSRTTLELKGASSLSGIDSVPGGWTDCTDIGGKAGGIFADSSSLDISGGAATTHLEGTPDTASVPDASMTPESFFEWGDMTYDNLAAMADKVLNGGDTYSNIGPVSSGGVCQESVLENWGAPEDPTDPCAFYYPIIYAPGDVHLSGGMGGQGILLVDGDLYISGGFQFVGVTIVKGALISAGSGNKIAGSVDIWGASSQESVIGVASTGVGKTRIKFSSCAIQRAALYNQRLSRAYPLHERSFIDLSGIGAQDD
ncbi:MAG: hypothetical protein P8174_09725 [Gemmatimonadota bacterium]